MLTKGTNEMGQNQTRDITKTRKAKIHTDRQLGSGLRLVLLVPGVHVVRRRTHQLSMLLKSAVDIVNMVKLPTLLD
jgi:hypothetical protein